jgi:hypothetical protein
MQPSMGQARRSSLNTPAVLILVAFALGLALLASGCGGGGSTGDSSAGDPEAYSACMRTHGVPNFPDPDSQGRIKITSGRSANGQKTGVDVNSPQFKKAQRACQKLQPSGGRPNRQEQAKEQRAMLKFAQCMRSHGVPNFPDPKFTADGGTEQTIGKDVNPGSPQFTAAKKACKRFLRNSPLAGETP